MHSKFTSIDAFGENFDMKIDKSNDVLKTQFGSLLTILVYVIVIAYTYIKIDVLIEKKDVDIMSTTMIDSISTDFIADNKETGLNLAIAFTDYSDKTEPILDKSYGELVFNAYEWGTDEVTGKYFVR